MHILEKLSQSANHKLQFIKNLTLLDESLKIQLIFKGALTGVNVMRNAIAYPN